MAIPLLFIGIAAITGATGIGKTVKAGVDNKKANSINSNANRKIERFANKLESARKECGEALEQLGKIKINVLNSSINSFISIYEKLKNVDLIQTDGLDELSKFHVDKKDFDELKEMGSFASSFATGTLTGATGGALTAFGAYSAASTFASASTGTAIATLSGAAKTHATLAFFGGGAKAVGGLGMMGGSYVLGGLVAGPALLVMGIITGAKAGKNVEDAYSNEAKAKEICMQLETAAFQCSAIRRRAYMFYNLLVRTDAYFAPLLYEMEKIVDNEGVDYSRYSLDGKKIVSMTSTMAKTIKAILDVPILTEKGELTKESEQIADEIVNKLKDCNNI